MDVFLAESHVVIVAVPGREGLPAGVTGVGGPSGALAVVAGVTRKVPLPLEQLAAGRTRVGLVVVNHTDGRSTFDIQCAQSLYGRSVYTCYSYKMY